MDSHNSIFQANLPGKGSSFALSDNNGLDHIAALVRRDGLMNYEQPLPDLMSWLVRSSPAPMLDVGANTGLFSLLATAASAHTKVYAFEPLESVRALLQANLALNKDLATRVHVYGIGLSNTPGTVEFYETINDYGLVTTSSSLEIANAQMTGSYRKQVIQTETLDGWAERVGLPGVGLIKVDVEGHEYAVIEGGRQTIRRHRPMMTIEVLAGARTESIDRMLFEEDYLDLAIVPGALRFCGAVRFHADGWNHLLCPAERMAMVLRACRDLGLRLEIADAEMPVAGGFETTAKVVSHIVSAAA